MSKVKRRDVFFFPGYDIAGVGRYHRFLERQCRWYARRFDVTIDVGPLVPSDIRHWSVSEVVADWPEGRVLTRFHICDWRADIARDYSPNAASRTMRMLGAWSRMVSRGQISRIARAAPLFAAVVSVPLLLLIARFAIIAAALWFVSKGGVFAAVGGLFSGLALLGSWRLGSIAYETFFSNYVIFLDQQLYGGSTQAGTGESSTLCAAIDALASHADENRQDEVTIAGHSYGGTAAMKAAAAMAGPGREISILTIGSNIPCIALEPKEQTLRHAITTVYETGGITWRDFFAPQDSLCFPKPKPIADFKLTPAKPFKADVKIRSAVYDHFVAPRKIKKFRWNVLRMHFQFMMAADRQGGFDWHRYTLGPDYLKDAAP